MNDQDNIAQPDPTMEELERVQLPDDLQRLLDLANLDREVRPIVHCVMAAYMRHRNVVLMGSDGKGNPGILHGKELMQEIIESGITRNTLILTSDVDSEKFFAGDAPELLEALRLHRLKNEN
jgi:hypothetical protein